MAKVLRCDRCDVLSAKEFFPTVDALYDQLRLVAGETWFDLCLDCQVSLQQWLADVNKHRHA